MKVLWALAAVVSVVAGWYGGPLVHPTSDPRTPQRPVTTAIGPVAMSAGRLTAEAMVLGEPIFWAGPAAGERYELVRTDSDRLYLRYLPRGVRPGAAGAHFLVIATYAFPGAYKALRAIARGRGVAGPEGSLVYVRPHDPRSVLIAFPRVPYEIEVYDPSPARAMAMAESGNVRPVV